MRGLQRGLPRAALVSLALALGGVHGARAQAPVLHEHVPDLEPDEALAALAEGSVDPSAIVYDGEVLRSPELDGAASDAPAMVAEGGDGVMGEEPGQRSPTFTPDRLTSLESRLDYYEAFNPAIAPFKRVTSLDATVLGRDGTPVLAIATAARRSVPIEGADAPAPDGRARDRFWGDVQLDFSGGAVVPLPSVSPESRILSWRSEPPVALSIERDGADNFFVALRDPAARGRTVRVTFLTDAPASYFGGAIPHAPLASLVREVPAMDPALARRARALAAELGVRPGADLHAAVHALVEHFRAFEESVEPPADSGDVLADLVRAKKGVCRHRAYAFVVLAHALGVPARFVQNEAHSFVEVKLAGNGWRRIDLGGAADGLQAHGAQDKPLYQAKEPDALPRPAAYEASYSQLGRNVNGLRKPADEQLAGRWLPAGPAADGSSTGSAFLGAPSAAAPAAAGDGRKPLVVRMDAPSASVLRGRELRVAGRIESAASAGVAGLRVEVSFAAQERDDRLLLGVTVTDAEGRFDARFAVPPDLEVGEYQLVVITPGDATHGPAIAR